MEQDYTTTEDPLSDDDDNKMQAETFGDEKITLHLYDIASGFEVRELNPVNFVTWTESATSRDLAEFVKNLTRGEWWFTHHGKWVSPSSHQP